jgi:hypothetical protein
MKRQPQPTAAENILSMAAAAGIALQAENGRLTLTTTRPVPDVLRRMVERHEGAILALLGGKQ